MVKEGDIFLGRIATGKVPMFLPKSYPKENHWVVKRKKDIKVGGASYRIIGV